MELVYYVWEVATTLDKMWTVTVISTEFADEKLASLSVDCPANLRTAEEFGLLVALWCGRAHDRIEMEDGSHEFSFGFHIGEVVVEPTGGHISNQGRLQSEGGRIRIANTETNQSKKTGSLGGQLGLNLSKWVGAFGKADAEIAGQTNRTVATTEQQDSEYARPIWRVADAGHNFWRVYGVDLNPENILENKIMGTEPICHIAGIEENDSVDVVVSFRCELRNLWFHHDYSREVIVAAPFIEIKLSEIARRWLHVLSHSPKSRSGKFLSRMNRM